MTSLLLCGLAGATELALGLVRSPHAEGEIVGAQGALNLALPLDQDRSFVLGLPFHSYDGTLPGGADAPWRGMGNVSLGLQRDNRDLLDGALVRSEMSLALPTQSWAARWRSPEDAESRRATSASLAANADGLQLPWTWSPQHLSLAWTGSMEGAEDGMLYGRLAYGTALMFPTREAASFEMPLTCSFRLGLRAGGLPLILLGGANTGIVLTNALNQEEEFLQLGAQAGLLLVGRPITSLLFHWNFQETDALPTEGTYGLLLNLEF